ncbi:RNA polymerase subunit sigma-24 [Lacrimispora sp. 38-1]|uniref:RNA polymerase subunit sigma-24 n=1 Tax=Lacrimispora sp. 38-1 TaxID=3125778 RepID=UPI003CF821B4
MKNYKESDYALNKFSEGIVYKFADRIVEVTLEDYLAENPGRTAEDFLELKALSDEIYHEQVMQENRTSRLDVSLNGLEETEALATPPLDTELIHKNESKRAMTAAKKLLDSGELTEIQRRRFILHFFKGYSYRKIAAIEGVFFTSVAESITAASHKFKKYFKNF